MDFTEQDFRELMKVNSRRFSPNEEFAWVVNFVGNTYPGDIRGVSLSNTFSESSIVGRVYSVEVEPDVLYYSLHREHDPDRDFFVVMIDERFGEFEGSEYSIGIFSKSQCPSAELAYIERKRELELD
jgi:hypothetical protein